MNTSDLIVSVLTQHGPQDIVGLRKRLYEVGGGPAVESFHGALFSLVFGDKVDLDLGVYRMAAVA